MVTFCGSSLVLLLSPFTHSLLALFDAEIAQSLCDELDRRFPQQELLDAFGIIYPQYWKQEGADASFPQHLSVLKKFYCHAQLLQAESPDVDGGRPYTAPEMLSASKLDNQQSLFKVTMRSNADATLGPPFHVNPVIKLWRNLSQSRHLGSLISEYFKVAEIGCCMVLGSVENERCFSTLKFLKSCHRNRLGKHLPLAVRMFGQKFYTLQTVPYKEAIDSWRNAMKNGRHGDL